MKALWSSYVIHFFGRRIMMKHVLSIADKCIKEKVHWQSKPNSTPRYKADNL